MAIRRDADREKGTDAMSDFIRSHWIETALITFYATLLVKSACIRDWPMCRYWLGALVLISGVLGKGK